MTIRNDIKKAVLEYDLGYEIIYLSGYLVENDYLITIEDNIVWMYDVQIKDNSGVYISNNIGLVLGKLKYQEINKRALISQIFDFMQNLSFYDFLRYYHDWTLDYNFQLIEAVS